MEYRDYYSVLGVPRSATQAEIKKAYRKLARQVHPDVKPGDSAAESRFKEINEAHEVLSDPDKRKRYDTLGANWDTIRSAGGSDPFGPSGPFAGYRGQAAGPDGVRYEFRTGGAGDFSDFFTFFFGGGAEAAARSGGRGTRTQTVGGGFDDLLAQLGLDTTTSGSSARSGSGGAGRGRTAAGGTRDVTAEVEVTLEEAFHGTTRLIEVDGRRLEVKVPRGVATGSRVRLAGQGGDGRDLILQIRVRPHATFRRRGEDLERDLRVSLEEALFGAEVPVATLKGRLLLRIPPGTQPGRRFRLAGQGMPKLKGGGTGDLYVIVSVVLPTALSPEAERAARSFVELARQPDPRA